MRVLAVVIAFAFGLSGVANADTYVFWTRATSSTFENYWLNEYDGRAGYPFDVYVEFEADGNSSFDVELEDLTYYSLPGLFRDNWGELDGFSLSYDISTNTFEYYGNYESEYGYVLAHFYGDNSSGDAIYYEGDNHWKFTLTSRLTNLDGPPVPLPATAPMLLSAIGFCVAYARRRAKRAVR
jgi:hypothetical protein